MYNITTWVARNQLLPFKVITCNPQAICLVILPISNNLFKTNKYLEINKLQHKMLAVLDLLPEQLTIVNIGYNHSEIIIAEQEKNNLTKKFLFYFKNIKLILQFGNLEFLDLDYLNLKKIAVANIVHPENILQNSDNKRQAYQDLLLCKTQLSAML